MRTRSDTELRAEVLALRHQFRVLERKVGKPQWRASDRIMLASLCHILPRSAWSVLLPQPQTLLRWHRELVRRKWAAFSRRPPRPHQPGDLERHALNLRLTEENPHRGYRRIQGEALQLGFRISHKGFAKEAPPRRGAGGIRLGCRSDGSGALGKSSSITCSS